MISLKLIQMGPLKKLYAPDHGSLDGKGVNGPGCSVLTSPLPCISISYHKQSKLYKLRK